MSTPALTRFVTVDQIAAHTGRHIQTVRRALRAAKLMPEREPGVHGKRLPLKTANRFIARQWPGTALMKEDAE